MIRETVTRKAFPGTTRKGSRLAFHAVNHCPYEKVLVFPPCAPVSRFDPSVTGGAKLVKEAAFESLSP